MKIIICGDSHGRLDFLYNFISHCVDEHGVKAAIHVGDFGFYPQVFSRMTNFRFPIPVYAIDGNHEDHTWLFNSKIRNKTISWPEKHNIICLDRGTIRKFGNATVGFIGGAFNVDRPQEGTVDRGTCNYPGPEEINKAAEEFNKYTLDLMVTHGCPGGIGIGIQGHPAFLPGVQMFVNQPLGLTSFPISDVGEQPLTDLYHKLDKKPTNWVFGHYHQTRKSQVGETDFLCAGCTDRSDGNDYASIFVFDTETKVINYKGKYNF